MLTLGYDSPLLSLTEDQLDRRRVALDIAELISTTPAEMSARIGLFGGWGTGKTTILEMLAGYLEERGYVIVRFNPATSGTFSDLVGSFADKLVAALINNHLYAEPRWKSKARKFRGWFASKNTIAVVDGLGELHKGAKLANAGLGLLASWLSPNGEQVRVLRASLPESRVLVLIDDLDRCPAGLLPRLLLALREILDIERFTFVLAFDQEIVAAGLKLQNPAWGDGQAFLEKILDFRFVLPAIETAAKVRLLEAELAVRASFVPAGSQSEVEDLLPDNPRRIKALVRSLLGLRPIIERHNKDELVWTDVWLVELLRQESTAIIEQLSNQEVFEEVLGVHYRFFLRQGSRGEEAKHVEDKAETLIADLKLDLDGATRVKRLFEAMGSRGSTNLHYVLTFANRPPALTWKEFDECLKEWTRSSLPRTLERWLAEHAERRQDSLSRVASEFCQATLNRLSLILTEATQEAARGQADQKYESAFPLLRCLVDFFSVARFATASHFVSFYNQGQYWVGVCRPGKEEKLRQAEAEALICVSGSLPDEHRLAVLEHLKPWLEHPTALFGPEERVSRGLQLRDRIAAILLPSAYRMLDGFLGAEGALRRLSESGRYEAFKGILFAAKLLPWPQKLRQKILDLIRGDIPAVNGYVFARSMLAFWQSVLAYRQGDVDRDGVKQLLRDGELLQELWKAIKDVEFTAQGEMQVLTIRAKLILEGADEADLPLEGTLLKRLPLFEEKKNELLSQL